MRQGMCVASGITAVDLFDTADTILAAKTIPDKAFEPVLRVDDNCLVFMLLVDQSIDGFDHIIELGGQGEAGTIDLVQAFFRGNEYRIGCLRCGGGFTDSFDTVKHHAGRLLLGTLMNLLD